jgi:beta-glucan synthesis-associated protein KRE6
MAPLRKAPPTSQRLRDVDEPEGDVQAGRSAASLGAERAAADVRWKPESPEPAQGESSGATLQRTGVGSRAVQRGSEASTSSSDRSGSYVPAVPSPLNRSSTHSSVSNNESRAVVTDAVSPAASSSSTDESSQSPGTSNRPVLGRRARRSSRISTSQQFLRENSVRMMRYNQIPRPGRPKGLRELGRDYSRYPPSISFCPPYARSPLPRDPLITSFGSRPSLLREITADSSSDSQSSTEKWGYPDDSIGAFDPYFGGEKGFILFADEVESDDMHHMPADDDDLTFKARWTDYFHKRAITSTIGGFFLVVGLILLFIILPALTFSSRVYSPTINDNATVTEPWSYVNNRTYPLLTNVRTGLIDPDTPESAKTRTSTFDGSTLNLVFSDEFNDDNRTFYEGDDPYWMAPNLWYGSTNDLEWYDPDAVNTGNGTLQLQMDNFPNHGLQYRSGMLNGWNQFCFKGGVVEVSVSLAGPSGVPGYEISFPCPFFP